MYQTAEPEKVDQAKRSTIRTIGFLGAAAMALGLEGCASLLMKRVGEKMISIDELFKDKDLTPVTSCLHYESVSNGVYAFDYPVSQDTTQDTRKCRDVQFKDFADDLGLSETGIKDVIMFYVKKNYGRTIDGTDLNVKKGREGEIVDVLYTGNDRYIRDNLTFKGVRAGHIKMNPGTTIYVAEADLDTEKVKRLRIYGYEMRKKAKKTTTNPLKAKKPAKPVRQDEWVEPHNP